MNDNKTVLLMQIVLTRASFYCRGPDSSKGAPIVPKIATVSGTSDIPQNDSGKGAELPVSEDGQ